MLTGWHADTLESLNFDVDGLTCWRFIAWREEYSMCWRVDVLAVRLNCQPVNTHSRHFGIFEFWCWQVDVLTVHNLKGGIFYVLMGWHVDSSIKLSTCQPVNTHSSTRDGDILCVERWTCWQSYNWSLILYEMPLMLKRSWISVGVMPRTHPGTEYPQIEHPMNISEDYWPIHFIFGMNILCHKWWPLVWPFTLRWPWDENMIFLSFWAAILTLKIKSSKF